VVVTAAVIVSGMAYSLWWAPVVRHSSWYWITPGDFWATVRTAHWIGWGSLSFVYSNPRSELITLPGFEVLFAPFVLLSSALGLTESPPLFFPNIHPHAWFLLGPISMATVAVALLATDGLARRLDVPMGGRRVLVLLEAVAMWPTLVLWGHPEDVLAVAFAVFALSMILDSRNVAAGWLLGGALAMQLFAILLVPVFVAVVGVRKGVALVARAAIFPAFLLLAVAIPDFHNASRILLQQPADTLMNHLTPWLALSPTIAHGYVAGGPARTTCLLVALGAGFTTRIRKPDSAGVVWLMAAVMASRCVFDAVMVPYYVMPAVAMSLVVSARAGWIRLTLTTLIGAGLTVMTFTHHGMWVYWVLMTALIGAMLASAYPAVRLHPVEDEVDHRLEQGVDLTDTGCHLDRDAMDTASATAVGAAN
jgi:hypothetical protein